MNNKTNAARGPFIFLLLTFALILGVELADAQQGGGAIVAIDEAAGSAGGSVKDKAGSGSQNKGFGSKITGQTKGTKAVASRPKAKSSVAPRPFSGAVLGDKYTFLNFEVVSAEKPIYRRAAKQSGASGLVQVEVLIDTDGSVISAKARTGNKLLWDEAERAALASKFNRPTDNGRPARAFGFLVYRFGPAEDDDNDY